MYCFPILSPRCGDVGEDHAVPVPDSSETGEKSATGATRSSGCEMRDLGYLVSRDSYPVSACRAPLRHFATNLHE
jgi:hypothetical protein